MFYLIEFKKDIAVPQQQISLKLFFKTRIFMKSHRILFFTITLLLFLTNFLEAQNAPIYKEALSNYNANFSINESFPTIGQSFVANQTGVITSISIMLSDEKYTNDIHKDLDFWIGENPPHGKVFEGKPFQKIKLNTHNVTNGMVLSLIHI